jgi:hypothetical protein
MQSPEWRVNIHNPNYVGIVSEGDIKIANTWANGSERSSGLGRNQTNQNLTSIAITAAVVALGRNETLFTGSFTFENQNDTDSGYVCTPCGCTSNPGGDPPNCAGGPYQGDRRGRSICGFDNATTRGYVHRSCCGGTGYLKRYRYDERFLKNVRRVSSVQWTVPVAHMGCRAVGRGDQWTPV